MCLLWKPVLDKVWVLLMGTWDPGSEMNLCSLWTRNPGTHVRRESGL